MNEKSKKNILSLIGILFIVFGVGAMINFTYNKEYALLLWLCYIALIIAGVGCLRKNDLLIVSQVNILLVPLILWNVDFFSILLADKSLFGITDYFFNIQNPITRIISIQHLFSIPLSLYALYLVKIKSRLLSTSLVSFFQVFVVFFITRTASSVEENINCVFRSCMSIGLTTNYYPLVWFVSSFLGILLTNFILIKIKFFELRKNKN